MKIGIDLRFLENDLYSKFVIQILQVFFKEKSEYVFTIYTNKTLPYFDNFFNTSIKKIKIPLGSFAEQFTYKKILKNDKNDLMIFFNQFKPIFYKKDYITFCGTLKDFYYANFSSFIERNLFFFLADRNFKNSKKVICLDKKTREELIEKFNIKYENISILNGFFPKEEDFDYNKNENLGIDILAKYSIKNDFFIYSGGSSIEKNYEKLISIFYNLRKEGNELDLVFIGDDISSNVNLRNLILDRNMQKSVFFLGEPSLKDKKYLYKKSFGVIFPSFYEIFPFKLTDALYFNTPILSSNLKEIKLIFGENINYFSPLSENSIYESIKKYLKEKDLLELDYSSIYKKYNKENSLKEFMQIFNEI